MSKIFFALFMAGFSVFAAEAEEVSKYSPFSRVEVIELEYHDNGKVDSILTNIVDIKEGKPMNDSIFIQSILGMSYPGDGIYKVLMYGSHSQIIDSSAEEEGVMRYSFKSYCQADTLDEEDPQRPGKPLLEYRDCAVHNIVKFDNSNRLIYFEYRLGNKKSGDIERWQYDNQGRLVMVARGATSYTLKYDRNDFLVEIQAKTDDSGDSLLSFSTDKNKGNEKYIMMYTLKKEN